MGQAVSKSKVFLAEDIKFIYGLANDNEKIDRWPILFLGSCFKGLEIGNVSKLSSDVSTRLARYNERHKLRIRFTTLKIKGGDQNAEICR